MGTINPASLIRVGSYILPESVTIFGLGGSLQLVNGAKAATVPFAGKSSSYIDFGINSGKDSSAQWWIHLATLRDPDAVRITSGDPSTGESCSFMLPDICYSEGNGWQLTCSRTLEAGSWKVFCNGEEIEVRLPSPSVVLERSKRLERQNIEAIQDARLQLARAGEGLAAVLKPAKPIIIKASLSEQTKTAAKTIASLFVALLDPDFKWHVDDGGTEVHHTPYLLVDVDLDSGQIIRTDNLLHIDTKREEQGLRMAPHILREMMGDTHDFRSSGLGRVRIYLSDNGTFRVQSDEAIVVPKVIKDLNDLPLLRFFE